MNRITNALVATFFAGGLAACGGGQTNFTIPVESELNPWVAPEADELLPRNDSDAKEEDYEEYEDEEEEDSPVVSSSVVPSSKSAAPAAPTTK